MAELTGLEIERKGNIVVIFNVLLSLLTYQVISTVLATAIIQALRERYLYVVIVHQHNTLSLSTVLKELEINNHFIKHTCNVGLSQLLLLNR